MIFRLTNRSQNRLFSGPSFRAALFCALLGLLPALLLIGCRGEADGTASADSDTEDTSSVGPPEAYPGVIDLPRATAAGFFRCPPAGAGTSGSPAPLSAEFVREYLLTPPWEPSMPAFLPVDPEEHRRWMRLMELSNRLLFRWDPASDSWQPDAAESAELDVASGTLTVRLREGLSWSDGTSATAGDWVRSVKEIYQLPGIQSPLADHTAAGGALWQSVNESTLAVTFDSIPPDPLSLLAIPPLPFSDPRIRSLAMGNIDVLYDLEIERGTLPRLSRTPPEGGTNEASGTEAEGARPDAVLAPAVRTDAILGTTGAADRGLIVLVSTDSPFHPLLPILLAALEAAGPVPDLFLIPPSPGARRLPELRGAEETQGEARLQEARVAYSFGSPAARAAAAFFARELETLGAEQTSTAPENTRVLDSQLPRFLSGDRALPGDLVIAEVMIDPTFSIPASLLRFFGDPDCNPDTVSNIDEWYNCTEGYLLEELAGTGAGSGDPTVFAVLGYLPRLVLLAPSACFELPVPQGAGAVDLLEVPGQPGEEQES